jgi:peptide/nickel transport system permease protein
MAGYSEEDLFYRNAFRRALPSLFALSDRTFSALAGSLVCLEYAFRYPGIGSLLVESVRLGSYGGILVSALVLAAFLSVGVLISECAGRLIKPGTTSG